MYRFNKEIGFAHDRQRDMELLRRMAARPGQSIALGALAATLLLWGTAFPGIRAALEGYGPGDLALGRFIAASIVLGLAAPLARIRRPARADLARLAVAGFLGVSVYHTLLNLGERTVTAGSASLVVSIMPPLTALGAVIFLRERLPGLGWAGIFVSLAGVAAIAMGDAEGVRFDSGVPLIAIGAAAFAATNIIQKPLLGRYTPLEFVAYSTWVGTAFLLVFSPELIRSAAAAPARASLALIYLGVFPAALGGIGWSYVLRAWKASTASASLLLIPVVATLVAWTWLGEVPTPQALAGGALTLAGVALVRLAARRSSPVPERAAAPIVVTQAVAAPNPVHERIPCRS
ncbi:MAG: DMT family transporter [Gemmatimonadota bacterium]